MASASGGPLRAPGFTIAMMGHSMITGYIMAFGINMPVRLIALAEGVPGNRRRFDVTKPAVAAGTFLSRPCWPAAYCTRAAICRAHSRASVCVVSTCRS
jgi:hypothetical protein